MDLRVARCGHACGRAGPRVGAGHRPTAAVRADPARRRGADRRLESGDARGARSYREAGRDAVHDPGGGRIWHRQGAGRAAAPRAQQPPQGTVRRGELCGDRRDAAGGGAVRDRGSYRDRRARPARQVRARARGHVVPGRSVRSLTGCSGQAAAGDPGSRRRAGRRHRRQASRHPDHRCDQQTAGGSGGERPVPARSVLPARRASRFRCRRYAPGEKTWRSWRGTSCGVITACDRWSCRPRRRTR